MQQKWHEREPLSQLLHLAIVTRVILSRKPKVLLINAP
jgi:hypothetical protein